MDETIHAPLGDSLATALGGSFGSSGGRLLPSQDMVSYWRVYDTNHFNDQKGVSDRTLYQRQYIQGPVTFTHAGLITACVCGVADYQGTAGLPSFTTPGQMTIDSGTFWSFQISAWGDGSTPSTYEFATPLTATTGVVFDTSGNGRHLLFTVTDQAAMDAVCQVSREKGSDWLNQEGFTVADGSQYLSPISFGLIPDNAIIPNLAAGGGCCAYEVA